MPVRSYFLELIPPFLDKLPESWKVRPIRAFSRTKNLFWFQEEAIMNALTILNLYFGGAKGDEENFKRYLASYFQDINDSYNWNRIAFWMATGSGKTIVMLKMVELIHFLMKTNKIPKKPILILSHKDELLNQIIDHWNESTYFQECNISITPLHKASDIAGMNELMDVYYYRSDLVGERQTNVYIDYRSVENDGNWYVFLDEAHKGEAKDSKRKQVYNILSRRGFLFNFSATFTDEIDYFTTVYNFNLKEFIKNGYGKQVVLLDGIKTHQSTDDDPETAIYLFAQGAILMYIAKKQKARFEINKLTYHNPLFCIFTNTTSIRKSDLEFFTEVLTKFVNSPKGPIAVAVAKKSLENEFCKPVKPVIGTRSISIGYDEIHEVSYQKILEEIFHSGEQGSVEYIFPTNARGEIMLRIKNAARPFGLIKIGNVRRWINEVIPQRDRLIGSNVPEQFSTLNRNDSSINFLMGSRVFYEGWDSLRPNIVFYINIGVGKAKKYLLQSLGRGVRINPFNSFRKRIEFSKDFNFSDLFNSNLLETLFVFPSNTEVFETIVDELELMELPVKQSSIHRKPNISPNLLSAKQFAEWVGDPRILYVMFSEIPNLTYKHLLDCLDYLQSIDGVETNEIEDPISNMENVLRNFLSQATETP